MAERRPYLSIGAVYRDEARHLREWVAFHRLVGVEHFFLYNNLSEDDHLEALAPFLDDGTVTLHDWQQFPPQPRVYDHCLKEHGEESRWIAFIDTDEFLFSPTGRTVADVLREYEAHPGVGVNWLMFGTSGHRTPPAGLVIENYTRRARSEETKTVIKSIVDPRRTERAISCHHFKYRDGFAVDELERPLEIRASYTLERSLSRLRINHYWTKSFEEASRKTDGRTLMGVGRTYGEAARRKALGEDLNAVYDDAIQVYLPALRAALRRLPETAAA